MPYRQGTPVAALPFPRRSLGLFTGVVVALSAMVFLFPLPLFVTRRGLTVFRQGGAGMFVLVASALFVAAACGLAGAFAVRGRRGWSSVVVAVPFVPVLLGALLSAFSARLLFGAIDAADAIYRMRILAAGLGENDALPGYGCFIGAIACGASAVALLAGGASIDRRLHHAPAGSAWAAPLAIGGLAFIVAVVLRFVFRAGFGTLLLVAPSLALTTAFACLAALNAPLVRHWREPREADGWVACVLAAAVLAGAAFVMLDLAVSFVTEGGALSAIAGEGVDSSQRARILAGAAEEHHAHRVLAIVDGLFGFVIVATVALAALGRGPDGRLRFPRGAPLYVALAAAALVVAATAGARAWELGRIEAYASTSTSESTTATAEARDADVGFELPRVPSTARLSAASQPGARLRVGAGGKWKTFRSAPSSARSSVLVVEADRRATWGDVSRAIRDALRSSQADLGAEVFTSIALRVTLLDKADRSRLGPYAALLGPEIATLHVALVTGAQEPDDDDDDLRGLRRVRTPALLRPRAHEIMDGIAASIAMRPTSFGTPFSPDIALLPPDGVW